MGYYKFSYRNTSAANKVAISISGTGDSFGHQAAVGAYSHVQYFQTFRCNAASIMVTPTCSVLNQSGSITSAVLPQGLDWTDYITPAAITTLNMCDYDRRNFSVGCYAFSPFQSLSDLQFTCGYGSATVNAVQVAGPTFSLIPAGRPIIMTISVDQESATVAPALNFYLTAHHAFEFIASDQWLEEHPCSYMYEDTTRALEILSTVPVFHDNPFHFSDVVTAVKSGAHWVQQQLPKLSSAFGTIFPHLAPVADAIASTLGNANSSNSGKRRKPKRKIVVQVKNAPRPKGKKTNKRKQKKK